MRKFHLTSSVLLVLTLAALHRAWAAPPPRASFVPLDDRPPTLLFVRQIARIGGAWLSVPPRALLGRFLRPGKAVAIAQWLLSQHAPHCIASSDMLCYGGLVASRNVATSTDEALGRLDTLSALHRRGVRVEVFGIIPRLSLRTSDREARYETALQKWATHVGAPYPKGVPRDVVEEYLNVRKRNLTVLLSLIERTARGDIDRLVIGQDDSAGSGLHQQDQAVLRAAIDAAHLGNRALLLSGADEIGMDMISGWLARTYGWSPGVQMVYSDPTAAARIPPLESLPLENAVASHVALAGARLIRPGEAADVRLFLETPFARPFTLPPPSTQGAAEGFATAVAGSVRADQPTALADVAIVNMADPYLARAVIARVPLYRLQAYAAWNTPSNKIGTVLAQAVVHRLAERAGARWSVARVLDSEKTQQAFLLARLVDDYRYQAIVRAQDRPMAAGLPMVSDPLLNLYGPVGLDIRLKLLAYAKRLFDRRFRGQRVYLPALRRWAVLNAISAGCVLPWQRLFEVELTVDMRLETVKAPPPPPPPRNLGPEPQPPEGPTQETH